MSCYNYTHLVREFADRTLENLQIIQNFTCNAKEVTQLINSFLGLLIVPSERYKEGIGEREQEENALRNYSPEMYSSIKVLIEQLTQQKKLFNNYRNTTQYPVSDFIHHLRNAVCHSGNKTLIFTPIEENKEIETVIFYDTYTDRSRKKFEFCAELTIDQIKTLIAEISTMYIAVEDAGAKVIQKEYEDAILRYRELMKK